ncbi:MAG: ABC transporter substrate-binding protein [Moraxella sp.]|nr:ABC transporter substrate-binding protein [Moraxella sp.]
MMNMLKITTLAVCVAAVIGCTDNAKPTDTQANDSSELKPAKTIAITTIVDHPSLNKIHQGVVEGLGKYGYIEGQNLTVNFQTAQGNMATAGQIAKQFAADNPDVIVAISTPSAQAVVSATQSIPVVYSAVYDPVAAKLINSDNQPIQANVTGLSNQIPLVPQIDLLQRVVPNAKRVGFVYSPGEANSVSLKDRLKTELDKRGLTLMDIPANRSADIAVATRALDGRADVIYTANDNNVASAFEAMAKVAGDMKMPIVVGDENIMRRGAAAAMGMNDYEFGVETAEMVAQVLDGVPPSDVKPKIGGVLTMFASPKFAANQGITLPADVLAEAVNIDDEAAK